MKNRFFDPVLYTDSGHSDRLHLYGAGYLDRNIRLSLRQHRFVHPYGDEDIIPFCWAPDGGNFRPVSGREARAPIPSKMDATYSPERTVSSPHFAPGKGDTEK